MNKLKKLFPELPKYSASWAPIYFEPIILSGERITIAVAVQGEDGTFEIKPTLSEETIKQLYGAKALDIQSLVEWTEDSLDKHLHMGKGLQDWKSPLEGVFIGELQEALDVDSTGVILQAIRSSSGFGSLNLEKELEEKENPKQANERWTVSIRKELDQRDSSLLQYLNTRTRINDSAVDTTFGFWRNHYVSNFGVILPTGTTSSLNRAKAKILDLETLRMARRTDLPETYELIVGLPHLEDPLLAKRPTDKVNDTLEYLKEVGKQVEVDVIDVPNAQRAVERLIERSAA